MRELVSMGENVTDFNLVLSIMSLLLAFVLGQLAAWTYVYTHQGLSYSRAFVQSIVLLTVIVSFAMMVIGLNIIIAFGLIGALSVIRFRNILKDTRDTAFIFYALIVGMATGTGKYQLAVLGAVSFSLMVLYLHWTAFGSRHTSDGFLRFRLALGAQGQDTIQDLLHRHCRTTQLMSQRFQEDGDGEIAYRLALRDPNRSDEIVKELEGLPGVSNITFVLHEEQAEI